MSVCCSPSQTGDACAVGEGGAPGRGGKPSPEVVRAWFRAGLAAMIAFQSMMFGLGINMAGDDVDAQTRLIIHSALAVAAVIAFALVSGPMLREAWRGVRARRVSVEQLFLAGVAGAFGASVLSSVTGVGSVYYEVVAILLAVYSLGQLLVEGQKRAAFRAAAAMEEAFRFCRRLSGPGADDGGAEARAESVPVREMRAGDLFLVPVGEGIALDGRVVRGTAYVRQSAVTGELFPVVKRPGDLVLGGSVTVDDALVVEAATDGTQRRIDALLQTLRDARERPSPWTLEADRLTGWFLPMVLAVAVVTAAVWIPLAGWAAGLFNALAVVLVACPCALGLATPIAIWSALNALGSRGIVARGGDVVERLAAVDCVVFDKTGTLSEDEVRVVDFVCADGVDRRELYAWISAVEARSTHPVARAFHAWTAGAVAAEGNAGAGAAGAAEAPSLLVGETEVIAGAGVSAKVRAAAAGAAGTAPGGQGDAAPTVLAIGNAKLLASDAGAAPMLQALRGKTRAPAGDSVAASDSRELYVTLNGRLVALGILRETLRPGAALALARLRDLGIPTVVMTGDTEPSLAPLRGLASGSNVAFFSGLTPEQKEEMVRAIQSGEALCATDSPAAPRRVLFVGDGINDAAAMARAHISVALSNGAELARESASAQLFRGDLSAIPTGIAIARQVRDGLRRNMIFAIAYNVLAMGLAATGWLHPVAAALVMLASSLTVTVRALYFAEKLRVLSEADLNAWFARFAVAAGAIHAAPGSPSSLSSETSASRSPSHTTAVPVAAPRLAREHAPLPIGFPGPFLYPVFARTARFTDVLRAAWHRADAACRPGLAPWIFAVCFAIQGPIVAHLGQTDMAAFINAGLTSLTCGVLVLHYWPWLRYQLSWQMAVAMLSAGNLAMLIGWWGDAGLGPIIREGVCLCGCAGSPLGKGLWHPHLMHLLMIAGSLPAMALVSDGRHALSGSLLRRVAHSITVTAGMLVGMVGSGYLIALLRLPNAQVEFFFAFFAMAAGMVLGMFAACALWRIVAERSPTAASTSSTAPPSAPPATPRPWPAA